MGRKSKALKGPEAPKEEYRDIYPQKGSQLAMLTSTATELFMGGEAGGGKSFGFLLDFLRDRDNRNANGLFLRRHYTDLEGILHEAQGLYQGFGAKFNEQKHTFIFPSGARLRFGHLNHIKDVYNYTGNQRTHYYWDELTQFPRLPYLLLMAWLRSPDPTIFKRIRASGNPDGEGLLWVKDRFIDKLEPYETAWFTSKNDRDTKMPPGSPGSITRQFIPCFREENLALMSKDPTYRDRLEQLPEEKKRAYKYGVWEMSDRPFQVVRTRDWVKAMNGGNVKRPGMYSLGADYAESGDKCAMCIGFGNQVRGFREWGGMTTDAFAEIIRTEARKLEPILGPKNISIGVDAIGPGTGVYHALKRMGVQYRLDPMRYKDKSYDRATVNSPYKIKFNNLRSQMWWKLKEDMEKGLIDLSTLQSEVGYYEGFQLLQEEVLSHTYTEEAGVIKIVDKNTLRDAEHLNRSPDRADALVIWNWVRESRKEFRPTPAIDVHFNPDFARNRQEIRDWFFRSAGGEDLPAAYRGADSADDAAWQAL